MGERLEFVVVEDGVLCLGMDGEGNILPEDNIEGVGGLADNAGELTVYITPTGSDQ